MENFLLGMYLSVQYKLSYINREYTEDGKGIDRRGNMKTREYEQNKKNGCTRFSIFLQLSQLS